ncbi:AfsR/SARP family transcriptional regulator [Catellatospora methionotrophica]|uniref:AfsR/SARP family transcriptional regulator n=1 Tax=Catellatospora methionotrophica TaxID=121620 RepID=UPI0033CB1B14
MTVLGPFTATRDGRPAALGGRRQRLVLAALLLARGRMLCADRLQELAWSDAGHVASRATLHGYVAQLRRALEPGHPHRAGELLVREGPGYALRLPAGALDADRFTDGVERGRLLLELGHTAEALSTLDGSLAMWRGPAYTGIDAAPFVLPETTRLDGLHATAVELRLAAMLDLGRLPAALSELEAVVIEQPLRERGWELLALARYRAGRQGDALAALRGARTRLAAELGVDPGPALRRMETAILGQEDSLQATTWPGLRTRPRRSGGIAAVTRLRTAAPMESISA